MSDETASEFMERVDGLKKRAADLYNNDFRFRAQAQSAVAEAMREYGPIDPDHAEQSAHDIARNAVALVMAMILDGDAELKFTRMERDNYRDQILNLSRLSPGIPVFSTQLATKGIEGLAVVKDAGDGELATSWQDPTKLRL